MPSEMEEDMAETLRNLREGDENDTDAEVTEEVEGGEVDTGEEQPVQEPVAAEPEAGPADGGGDVEPARAESDGGERDRPEGEADPSIANPPSTWRAGAKAKWSSVDPDIRAEILKRENDSIRGYQNLKETADFGEQMQRTIQPYMPTIRSKGIAPEQAVDTMLNAYYTLETGQPAQKAQALLATAQEYGCINEVISLISGNGQQPPQQPVSQQDIDRIVQQRIEAEKRQTEESRIEQEVADFVNATNEDGTSKHPYYNDVWQDMVGIIQAGKSSGKQVSLEEAYERATWANPETRTLIADQQRQQEEAKRQKEAKARAEKAKKADAVNLGKSPSHEHAEPSNPTGDIEDTMRDTLESIKQRAG